MNMNIPSLTDTANQHFAFLIERHNLTRDEDFEQRAYERGETYP